MSGIIHFASGKTLDITEEEFQNISPKLNSKGIKTQVTAAGHKIPLNSNTMEFIEWVPQVEEEEIEMKIRKEESRVPIPEQKEQEAPKKKTNDEMIADMMEKSNCKHEPDKQQLHIQHTAKGVRYFPVCSFCGFRGRYVSEKKILQGEYVGTPNEKWTEDDLNKAIPWVEK